MGDGLVSSSYITSPCYVSRLTSFVLLSHSRMVFDCRFCSDIPLSSWLGLSQGKSDGSSKPTSRLTTPACRPSKRNLNEFLRRSDEEISTVVSAWEAYVHPRAREFFPTHDMLVQVLTQIARSVNSSDDPVLGSDMSCCHWFGEVTKEEPQQACIRMVKPGEATESTTFVNRVLVFIFATDESFEQLMRLPKEPFRMTCSDQLCVSLNHISVE